MARQTTAILKHYSQPLNHNECPPGKESWCSYRRDPKSHVPISDPLPAPVVEVIEPVFRTLSNETLLVMCQQQNTKSE